jgi:predicted O-methyltransferase YrrM
MNGVGQIRWVTVRSRRWVPQMLRPGGSLASDINRTVSDILSTSEILRLDAVSGWFRMDEGMTLFYFAYHAAGRGRIVEIGTFLGKATAWMASALRARKSPERLVTMDPHRPLESWEAYYDLKTLQEQRRRVAESFGMAPDKITTYELFIDNIAALELSDFVTPIRGMSTEVIEGWTHPIRLLFVDGAHTYDRVLKDLQLWEPWVTRDGIICMHDTGSWEGVARAVREYLMVGRRFQKLLFTGNLTVFRKRVPCSRSDRAT